MQEPLSARFMRSKGEPINVDGDIVHGIYRLTVEGPRVKIAVRRIAAANDPLQALIVKVVDGKIEIEGQKLNDVVLWADTAPETVEFNVLSKKKTCEVRFWNAWRMKQTMHAWIGNSGMLVQRSGNTVTLRCSHGVGDVDFNVFVVEIKLLS